MIYISTGGYSEFTASETIEKLSQHNIHSFELSGGKYSPNLSQELIKISNKNNLVVHNYFPPPEIPFVINLASLDEKVFKLSFDHIKNSIKLASLIKSPYYSFHAGFLVDLKVNELGKSVLKRDLFDKNKALSKFISAMNFLSEFAEEYNVKLIIENNVLTKGNLLKFGENPMLMVDLEGTEEIFQKLNRNIGLLIDVAHLKVSALTLNFDPGEYMKNFNSFTLAYHLSDNDGKKDSNESISNDSWFWPYLRRDLDYYSLEIYNQEPWEILSQLKLVKDFIN